LQKSRVGGIAEQANMNGRVFCLLYVLFADLCLLTIKKFKYWFLYLPFGLSFIGILTPFPAARIWVLDLPFWHYPF